MPMLNLAMRQSRSLALTAIPGAAALALWHGYRRAVNGFRSEQVPPSRLPGQVHHVRTDWGRVTYRIVQGSKPDPALLLVHGWGRSADSVWWRVMENTERTVIALDLPGHGRSTLDQRFTFELAAQAVQNVMADSGLIRPILVAHSMGGPVALTSFRHVGPQEFAGFIAIATSAYWVRPRHQIVVAAGPYVLGPRSPIVKGAMRAEMKLDPTRATQVAKGYAMRPARKVLMETASELKRFDARQWPDLTIPEAVWIITAEDGVISPEDQWSSADHFGIRSVEIASDHPAPTAVPRRISEIIEESHHVWSSWPSRRSLSHYRDKA